MQKVIEKPSLSEEGKAQGKGAKNFFRLRKPKDERIRGSGGTCR